MKTTIKVILAVLALAILLSLGSCSSDSSNPVTPTIPTYTVGVQGGEITTADGAVHLIIPQYALDTTIAITVTTATTYPVSSGYVSGTCYRFGPDSLVFNYPVQLSVRYDAANVPVSVAANTLGIFKVGEDGWMPVSGSSVNTDSGFVTAELDGFSSYGVVGKGGNIYEGDYVIDSTAKIAPFADYTGITGTLTIVPGETLPNLNGLDSLNWVGGDLVFEGTDPEVFEIGTGLAKLEEVHGTFYFYYGNAPTVGLPKLRAVGGNLRISGDSVATLSFPKLRSIGDTLMIRQARSLLNCRGLDSLSSVGDIYVSSCSSMLNLSGLSHIHGVVRSVMVGACGSLTSLTGLGGVSYVSGEVEINNNDALTTLSGLNLKNVGQLSVAYNDLLHSLGALQTLSVVRGSLAIDHSPALDSAHGYLNGLGSLGQVQGFLRIAYNRSLKSLNGLAHLSNLGGLGLEANDSLVDISALDNVYSIDGPMDIKYNYRLRDLNGFERLRKIGSMVEISNNYQLRDITALHNLTISSGTYVINGKLAITYNSHLGNANAWAFVTAIGGESKVKGPITISDN